MLVTLSVEVEVRCWVIILPPTIEREGPDSSSPVFREVFLEAADTLPAMDRMMEGVHKVALLSRVRYDFEFDVDDNS
jgi:hypothetical protein